MDSIIHSGTDLHKVGSQGQLIYKGLVGQGWMDSLELTSKIKDGLKIGSLVSGDGAAVSTLGKIAGYAGKAGAVLGKAAPIIGGIFGGLQIAEGVAALNSGDTNKGVLKIASGGIDLACVGMLAAGPLGWIAAGVIQIGKFIGENWGDQIIEGVKGFAGAAGKAIGDFADGAGKFLGDVGKGVGDFFGGIGKALTGG